jgi:hypothetical protein
MASQPAGEPTVRQRAVPVERRIADVQVRQALDDVCDPSVIDTLTALVHHPLGRPRLLTVEGLLAAMQLCADRHDGTVRLDRVTAILQWAVSPQMRQRFGVPERAEDAKGFEAAYIVVRRLFHQVIDTMDPSPLPKNRRLDKSRAAQLITAAKEREAELHEHSDLLLRATNAIVEESLNELRPHLRRHWDGSLAVDGTPIRTYAKGLRSTGPELATDPDAGWYVRTGDHRDPDTAGKTQKAGKAKPGKKKDQASKAKFGYDATLAIARNPTRDGVPLPDGSSDPRVVPAVVVGFTLDKPGVAPGPNALRVLTDVHQRDHPAGYCAGDRAYNNTSPEDFQLPARRLGYELVFDYRSDQLGIQAGHAGALQVEGTWYCPALPELLATATTDLHAQSIEKETWIKRIAGRVPFQLVPKQHPDADGRQRMSCPASAGHLQCPIKKQSLGRDPRLPLADPAPRPTGPAKICTQHTITIPAEAGAQHHQALAYGGADWQRVYHRLRNSVEHFNGFAKDDLYEAIEHPGTRRIRGIAAQTFLLAFQLAHANRRKISTWLDTLTSPGQPAKRRPTRRRPTKEPGTWTPTGHLEPAAS